MSQSGYNFRCQKCSGIIDGTPLRHTGDFYCKGHPEDKTLEQLIAAFDREIYDNCDSYASFSYRDTDNKATGAGTYSERGIEYEKFEEIFKKRVSQIAAIVEEKDKEIKELQERCDLLFQTKLKCNDKGMEDAEKIHSLTEERNAYRESFENNKEQFMELAAHAKDLEEQLTHYKELAEAVERLYIWQLRSPDSDEFHKAFDKYQSLKNKSL